MLAGNSLISFLNAGSEENVTLEQNYVLCFFRESPLDYMKNDNFGFEPDMELTVKNEEKNVKDF